MARSSGNTAGVNVVSDIARNDGHGENTPYFDGWKAYDRNPYNPSSNPNGVIQMGLAENQLCFDLIEEWIRKNPTASICTPQGVNDFKDVAVFQDYHGLPQFREAIAKFMSKVRGGRVRFDPNRVVMGGGATGANEILMFCLANPGDAFLVPTPYYPGFVRDLCWRTGVKIIPVPCESSNNFMVTKQALEKAYVDAKSESINVRGLIVTNPSNPLGTTLDRQTLETLVRFAGDNKIHLVCDEIYAATVSRSPPFVSVAEVIASEEAATDKNLVHIVSSLSKDMGIPGLRVGIVYSYNDAVVAAARRMSSFGLVSSQTQRLLASMLSDEPFVAVFLAESALRLAGRRRTFEEGLAGVGVGCLRGNAGLFLWMDLRRLLPEPSFDGEMALWRVVLDEVKLDVSPGSSFHCPEPGWFRVCFANMDDDTVGVALRRIREFVAIAGEETPEATEKKRRSGDSDDSNNKKKMKKKQNLRLSLTRQESFKSSAMSPHSPVVPPSPLVRAQT